MIELDTFVSQPGDSGLNTVCMKRSKPNNMPSQFGYGSIHLHLVLYSRSVYAVQQRLLLP